jgi:hypothetical protein
MRSEVLIGSLQKGIFGQEWAQGLQINFCP